MRRTCKAHWFVMWIDIVNWSTEQLPIRPHVKIKTSKRKQNLQFPRNDFAAMDQRMHPIHTYMHYKHTYTYTYIHTYTNTYIHSFVHVRSRRKVASRYIEVMQCKVQQMWHKTTKVHLVELLLYEPRAYIIHYLWKIFNEEGKYKWGENRAKTTRSMQIILKISLIKSKCNIIKESSINMQKFNIVIYVCLRWETI